METGHRYFPPLTETSDIASAASDSEALKQFNAELHIRSIDKNDLYIHQRSILETNDRFDRAYAAGSLLCTIIFKTKGKIESMVENEKSEIRAANIQLEITGMPGTVSAQDFGLTEQEWQELMGEKS